MGQLTALEALFPGPRCLVLGVMFQQPERWWSLVELAGRAGVRPGSLRVHLARFRQGGVIRQKAEGGHLWFQPDSGCPIFTDLHSIISKLNRGVGGPETILVVEDQAATARITRILLESWGYRVLEAHSGEEALETFEQHGAAIRLLLTDICMPGISGPQLAHQLAVRNPQLPVVLMSGESAPEADGAEAAFLPKPFNPAGLSRIVRKALDHHAANMKAR